MDGLVLLETMVSMSDSQFDQLILLLQNSLNNLYILGLWIIVLLILFWIYIVIGRIIRTRGR